jgi:hypothetical protein
MLNFGKEWTPDELHVRDAYQFELKSDLFVDQESKKREFTQDFYLFIPQALQINTSTYSKDEFYRDQTFFIRKKTPEFTLEQLSDPSYTSSPLTTIRNGDHSISTLKLFGNCFRSALRKKCIQTVHDTSSFHSSLLEISISTLCSHVIHILTQFRTLSLKKEGYKYIDEFLSVTVDFFLTALFADLEELNKLSIESKKTLTHILKQEKEYRLLHFNEAINLESAKNDEMRLYRKRLLNKFIFDVLLLKIDRVEIVNHYKGLVASFAAGLAMLLQLLLLINFVHAKLLFESMPFIFASVLIYILKDRAKDGIKDLLSKKGKKGFADYKTKILTPDKKTTLGMVRESFNIFSVKKLPEQIRTMRNQDFHTDLEKFKRPETVLYYSAHLKLNQHSNNLKLNTIFRFNIWKFLAKAGDPFHMYHDFDMESFGIQQRVVPKTYHLNLIIKETSPNKEISYRKYRVILNKLGIVRLERIGTKSSLPDFLQDSSYLPTIHTLPLENQNKPLPMNRN